MICLNTSNELDLTRNLEKKNENYCVNTEKLPVVEKTMKENEIHELLNELSLKPARKKMSDYKFWNTQPVCSFGNFRKFACCKNVNSN